MTTVKHTDLVVAPTEGDEFVRELLDGMAPRRMSSLFGGTPAVPVAPEHPEDAPPPTQPVRVPAGPRGGVPPPSSEQVFRSMLTEGPGSIFFGVLEPEADGTRAARWGRL
jgi:hypothetical protein